MVSLGILATEIILFLVLWIVVKIFVFKLAKIPLLFVTIKEGEAAAIMSGEKLERIIMNMKGSFFDKYYNIQKTQAEVEKEIEEIKSRKAAQNGKIAAISEIEDKSIRKKIIGILNSLFSFSGVYWLGLPNVASVYEYNFTWTRMKFNPETEKKEKITTTEKIRWIYVKSYQYVIDLELAETSSMAAVSIPFFVRINIINPYIALFKNDSWLDTVSSAILDAAREFIATLDDPDEIMELAKGKKITVESGLIQKLPAYEDGIVITSLGDIILQLLKESGKYDYIEGEVGAHISEIDVTSVDLGTWTNWATKRIEAEKEGEALIATAGAKATALRISTDAETEGYGKVMRALGVEPYLALKKIGEITAASKVGTTVVLDVSSIKDIIAGIGGNKIADTLNGSDSVKQPVTEKESETRPRLKEIEETKRPKLKEIK